MKNWVKIVLWSLFGILIILIGIKIQFDLNAQILPEPNIVIHLEDENAFITETELLDELKLNHFIFEGQKIDEIDTEAMEQFIGAISHVKSVDVFQQINGEWQVDVFIRKPIARIFNIHGETFYLDAEGNTMTKTASHTARTLIFTGEIHDRSNSASTTKIINNDSLISIRKLDDIYRISAYVCNDPLFHSLVGQIHLEKDGDFILVPVVGDQKIIFGTAHSTQDVELKFEKLRVFYTEAIAYEGWTKYAEINLKYEGQIVCKKKNLNE